MPKSKRNKTVDLCKTKKHGLEGKKELYRKIQSNVENYAHIFVFAVNDMRNSKMKNVREQWKHSRFCIGKNRVMALALGRTPEEEYRPNLHKIGQMLVGERGLFFTNQSVDEVTKWFQSYSEADYARSGNIATEDVILPEGPLAQFPHNLESYLRQLGLPTTLKKGVIHLVKEHVVCREGDRLSPETARILKLLGYEMAEFRIRILSVWSQDGSFVSLQSDTCDPESKENVASPQKSFMKEGFELAKDCLLLGDDDDDEMDVAGEDSEDEEEVPNLVPDPEKDTETQNHTEDLKEDTEVLEIVKLQTPTGKKSSTEAGDDESLEIIEEKQVKSSSKKKGKKSFIEAEENSEDSKSIEIIPCNLEEVEEVKQDSTKNKTKSANQEKQSDAEEISEINRNSDEKVSDKSENEVSNSNPTTHLETEDVEMEVEEIQEPEVKKPKNDSNVKKSGRKPRKTVNKKAEEETEEKTNGEIIDSAAILKLTEEKLEQSAEKPKKFSPKMTRARAAAANKKIKTPEPLETKRSNRKRKM